MVDSPLGLFLLANALIFQVDRSWTVRPRRADHPNLTFSDSADWFQTVFIAVTGMVHHSAMGTDRPCVRRSCASCT
jgi:hypothetical protein